MLYRFRDYGTPFEAADEQAALADLYERTKVAYTLHDLQRWQNGEFEWVR